ncbi:MAG: hypothetical protein IJT37_03765 [Lachnospiraceae bacterium]|nr:hypothetical protein [Lachnospiraceae bacterium]
MIDYGLKGKVAIVTGANNPQGIGATTALAFAREGAGLVLVYKMIPRQFDENNTDKNGVDRYYAANAGDAAIVESRLKELGADYFILESDISNEEDVKKIYGKAIELVQEQFRNERISEATTRHQLDGIQRMFAKIIKGMMDAGIVVTDDPKLLAVELTAPAVLQIARSDRQPQCEKECMEYIEKHLRHFCKVYMR